MKLIPLLLILCYFESNSQQKKIYIANDDHTDYMWTTDEEGYKQAFLETLDYYIKLNDSTANETYAYQNKWNCDGSYWAYTFEKNRSQEEFNKFIAQVKAGKITVPLNTLVEVLGVAPAEATIRDMYYAGYLERKYGLDLDLAIAMEDQVLPLGLSSLWAGSGAKYSWKGVCACATKVKGLEYRPHDIYWYKGLDDQRILMKWYSVNHQMIVNRKEYRYTLGTYLEASKQKNAITDCKDLMNQTKRYPYSISGAFGKGGDELKTLTNNFPKVAKANSDSDYQIIVSNEIDFFKDIEKTYGHKLPSETVSYGSTEWGNSVASLAEVSATVKRSIEKLRAAEGLYTLVALHDSLFASQLKDQREKAWIACGLYFEHDWTADGPITRKQRADWQRKIAGQLIDYVNNVFELSKARLGTMISKPTDGQFIYVYNPLSWKRTDYGDYQYNGAENINIVDADTKATIPFQFITKNGKTYLRLLATDVPSLGYKIFELRKGSVQSDLKTTTVTGGSIENKFYKIKVSEQGAIISLLDKRNNNRECIQPLNKLYANDLGSGLITNPLHDTPLRVENDGPVSTTLVAESYSPLKHTSKITLFKDIDRIEIENYINQNLGAKPTTYSFSLNLHNPETWHEEAGAILNIKPLSKGGHYADSLCRLDWVVLNHFVDMSDNNNGMILSNRDAYFVKTGNTKVDSLDYTNAQLNVLAAGRIDNALGIENQDGDSYFENFFAMKPYVHKYNAPMSMQFSLEHQNPLVMGDVTGSTENVYPSNFSLFTVSDPNILVWAVKPAEEGIKRGIILRVWNLNDKDSKCIISTQNGVKKCIRTTHIETDINPISLVKGKIVTTIGHNKIETFRIFINK